MRAGLEASIDGRSLYQAPEFLTRRHRRGPTRHGQLRPQSADDEGPMPMCQNLRRLVLLVQPPTELAPTDAAVVARVEQDPETAIVAKLARQFTALVRA